MHLKQDQKLLVFITIFGLLAAVIIGVVLVPTINSIRQADQDTYNLRVYLEKKYDRSRNAHSSIEEIDKIKDEVATFDTYVYHASHELTLITMLEDLATHDAVTQKIVSTNLDSITNQRITLSLNLTGSYHNALVYLNDLEHLPYFITVTHVSLSPSSDVANPTAKDTVTLNVDLSLYVAN